MGVGDALGQIAEERRHVRGNIGFLVGGAEFVEVLRPGLLHDRQTPARC